MFKAKNKTLELVIIIMLTKSKHKTANNGLSF